MDKEANRGNLLEDREEREKQLETAVGNKRPITISLSLSLSSIHGITAVGAIIASAREVWPEYKAQVDAPTGPPHSEMGWLVAEVPLAAGGCVRSPLPWNAEYDYLHLGTDCSFVSPPANRTTVGEVSTVSRLAVHTRPCTVIS